MSPPLSKEEKQRKGGLFLIHRKRQKSFVLEHIRRKPTVFTALHVSVVIFLTNTTQNRSKQTPTVCTLSTNILHQGLPDMVYSTLLWYVLLLTSVLLYVSRVSLFVCFSIEYY